MSGETRTRFKIFVQSPILGSPFDTPQVISVDRPPADIAAGPTDVDRGTGEPLIHVLDARKRRYDNRTPHHYDEMDGRPWTGAKYAKAAPGPDGQHFDHLDPVTHPRQFAQAAVYGSIRFTLELWQKYFKMVRPNGVRWHHRPQGAEVDGSLELYPWSKSQGARAGYGFIEFGHAPKTENRRMKPQPLWRNFDVIAHELGHSMLFAILGFPENMKKNTGWYSDANVRKNGQFLAFHESAGDLVAMIASLHHDTVIDRLLHRTGGDLRRGANLVSKVGEFRKAAPGDLAHLNCIRNAASPLKITELTIAEHGPHRYSLPLTGAIYDLLVDEYEASRSALGRRESLEKARDYIGELLARAWCSHLSADGLVFEKVRKALLEADREMGGQRKQAIKRNFAARGIS
jgi:hypothetical protein